MKCRNKPSFLFGLPLAKLRQNMGLHKWTFYSLRGLYILARHPYYSVVYDNDVVEGRDLGWRCIFSFVV